MRLLKSLVLLASTVAAFQAPHKQSALSSVRPVQKASLVPMNSIKITVRPSESVDSVIMRLRREVNKSGHLRTLRNKRYHEDAREKKKRKLAESRRKMKFARQRKRRAVRTPAPRILPGGAGRGAGRAVRKGRVAHPSLFRRSSRARERRLTVRSHGRSALLSHQLYLDLERGQSDTGARDSSTRIAFKNPF